MATELPLFPLGTVLFPDGPLPLRIFETRYTDMVRRCMREDSPFGVVLIIQGAEAGAVSGVARTGTTARIIDFSRLDDGLLGIKCRGERRFRLLHSWRQDDGLNMGEVEFLEPSAVVAVPDDCRHLARPLQQAWDELREHYGEVTPRWDDANWLLGRLTELLPLPMPQKQQLLEMDDPATGLRELATAIKTTQSES